LVTIAHSFSCSNPGNTYHQDAQGNYLPILPRGDPNKPRSKPRFSVADTKAKEVAGKSKQDEIFPQIRKGTSSISPNKTVNLKTSNDRSVEHKASTNHTLDDVITPEKINVDYKTSNNDNFGLNTLKNKIVDSKISDKISVDNKSSSKTFVDTKYQNVDTKSLRDKSNDLNIFKFDDRQPMLDRDFEEGGGILKLIFLHCFPV
jgi:hypothetical protein